MPRQAALTGGLQLARRFLMPTINSPAQLGIPGWQKLKYTWRELFLHHQVENNPIFLVYPTYYFSVSSRRKRESYGNLIEYQEYEELSVRKKREEVAAVVETEEEIALRSYGSRLRCFPSNFSCSIESFTVSFFFNKSFLASRYECGPARRFLDDFEQLHYLDRWTVNNKSMKFP